MATSPSFAPVIGPDGLPRESPVIAYTEKIIEEEQIQLRKYIEENYSKIRDVERELSNLTLEVKLTSGPKKAALELLRKKIEMQTERISAAKQKEEQARKVWEAASKAVKDEEAVKQKLCDDLSQLVQESSSTQYSRLEELKRRLEALNPSRASISGAPTGEWTINSPQVMVLGEKKKSQSSTVPDASSASHIVDPSGGAAENVANIGHGGNVPATNGHSQQPNVEGEGRGKKKNFIQGRGRGRGIGAVPKGRGSSSPGWTGAGFDVDGRT